MLDKAYSKPQAGLPIHGAHGVFRFGPFTLDAAERVLLREGETVSLTPKAFDTLLVLARSGGRLVEKGRLLEEVWPDTFVEEKTLAQNVLTIRRALGRTPEGTHYVETVPKHGYRLAAPVSVVPRDAAGFVAETRSRTEVFIEEEFEITDDPTEAGGSRTMNVTPFGARDTPEVVVRPALAPAFAAQSASKRRRLVLMSFAVAACVVMGAAAFAARRWLARGPFERFEIKRLTATGDVGVMALSPDGKYAALVTHGAGRARLVVRQTDSTSGVEVVPAAEAGFTGVTFASDGASVYYVRVEKDGVIGVLYSVPVLGGTPKKIIEDVDSPVAVSPDGARLAFVRVSRDQKQTALVVADSSGANERTLAVRGREEGFSLVGPTWSPDNRLLACASNGSSNTLWSAQLLIVDAEDGEVKTFSPGRWSWIGRVAWLKEGGIALVGWDRASQVMSDQIWYVSYPDGEARRVTNDVDGYFGVSVSADSRVMLTAHSERVSGLWVSTPTGADARKIAGVSSDLYSESYGMSWTPDGRVVYGSTVTGQPNVWVMDGDGSNRRQLTSEPGGNVLPAVSPDGRQIAFISYRTGERHVWLMNSDGTEPRQLTKGSGDNSPAFTPDGAWVIYTAISEGEAKLFKIPTGGGEPVRLSDINASAPAVSPDGRLVACLRFTDPLAAPKVALVSLEDGRVVRELDPPRMAHVMGVKWTPDGGALAYVSASAGVGNLWLQPADGSPARPLTDFNSDRIFRFDIARDGRIIYERGTTLNDAILIRSE